MSVPHVASQPNQCKPLERTAPYGFAKDFSTPPPSPPPDATSTNSTPTPHEAPKDKPDLSVLDSRRIQLSNPPPMPVSVYSLAGQQICTGGNLTNIKAQAKAGNTAALGCIMAAALASETNAPDDPLSAPDCLCFTAAPHGGKAVIQFDTEQAPYDAYSLVRRAEARAGVDNLPLNFRCYSVADIPTAKRRHGVEQTSWPARYVR